MLTGALIMLGRDHIPETLTSHIPSATQAVGLPDVTGRGHRAFARSASGADWGLRTEAASPDEAATDALRQCNSRRPEGGVACQLVHLDDAWVLPEG